MELVNQTALTAAIEATEVHPDLPRIGAVTAKATFRFDQHGKVDLERDEPLPILSEDEETDLGLLPRDNLARRSEHFEVILLGAAHAPPGKQATEQRVRLSVGPVSHELLVTGDRHWLAQGGLFHKNRISDPVAFERIPITWERAFGGSHEVLIDTDSPVTVSDPRNPIGRGFDVSIPAGELARELKVPKGFPVYDPQRLLPNIEDPDNPIRRWEDAPFPAGWSTFPLDSPMHGLRIAESGINVAGPDQGPFPPAEVLLRAHPDWVIDLPARGARISLAGLLPGGNVEFSLPELRVLADYVVGEVQGTAELRPMVLVLLPDSRCFYIVYRLLFDYPFEPTAERSVRLRTEEGWFERTRGT